MHIYKGGSFIYPYNPSPWKPYAWKLYRSFPAAEAGIGVRCVWSKTDHNLKLLPTVKERGFWVLSVAGEKEELYRVIYDTDSASGFRPFGFAGGVVYCQTGDIHIYCLARRGAYG